MDACSEKRSEALLSEGSTIDQLELSTQKSNSENLGNVICTLAIISDRFDSRANVIVYVGTSLRAEIHPLNSFTPLLTMAE